MRQGRRSERAWSWLVFRFPVVYLLMVDCTLYVSVVGTGLDIQHTADWFRSYSILQRHATLLVFFFIMISMICRSVFFRAKAFC